MGRTPHASRLDGLERRRLQPTQNDADDIAHRAARALEVARAPVRGRRLTIVRDLGTLVVDVDDVVDDHLERHAVCCP